MQLVFLIVCLLLGARSACVQSSLDGKAVLTESVHSQGFFILDQSQCSGILPLSIRSNSITIFSVFWLILSNVSDCFVLFSYNLVESNEVSVWWLCLCL